METADKLALFDELIAASTTLAKMCNNYGEYVDERFSGMVLEPLEVVNDVLARCPLPGQVWDGKVKDDQLEVEFFRSVGQSVNEEPKGVKMKHIPTGIQVETYAGPNRTRNIETARAYIEQKAQGRWEELQK